MEKPLLVLLTTTFPFGQGEEFLESEIVYLAEQFSVEIIPASIKSSDLSTQRYLPDDVCVRKDIGQEILRKRKQKIKSFFFWVKDLYHHFSIILQELPHLPWKLSALRKFVTTIIHASFIKESIEDYYKARSVAVHYSYWLDEKGLALALLAPGNITIARAHSWELYDYAQVDGYQPYQARIVANLNLVFCISQHGQSYLQALYPEHASNILVSRLGVQPAAALAESSNDSKLHLVTCSYLTSVKRISLLLKALDLISIPVTWTHLGGGLLESTLRKQAKHLPQHVEWSILGLVPNTKVLEFYQTEPVDLFINVSSLEGLPVSIMEAMAYGIPVAATDVGGTKELVNSKNGYLWPDTPSASQIKNTLEHHYFLPKQQKEEMRQQAIRQWANSVNAEKQYREFTQLLARLMVS